MTDKTPKIYSLGEPIPTDPHAVSVSLPAWADVVGYEEGDPRVINALKAGYPRFAFHPAVTSLHDSLRQNDSCDCFAFIDISIADECAEFIAHAGINKDNISTKDYGNYAVVHFPKEAFSTAKAFWQHSGYGVPSRAAEAILNQETNLFLDTPPAELIERLSTLSKADANDILLYPSGCSAFYAIQRVLQKLSPNSATIQYGFPYIDTLKIQEKFGDQSYFILDDLDEVEKRLQEQSISAIYTEFPSNPLLSVPDLHALRELADRYGAILIIDDTISGFHNTDLLPHSDILVSSLTKNFSGKGNVMAGSLILNTEGQHYSTFKNALLARHINRYSRKDFEILSENSRDYSQNAATINDNAQALAEFLNDHPLVDHIYYPSLTNKERYDHYRTPQGGYGCLLSIILKDPEDAPLFYDALPFPKGPTLGNEFTLCCPYTLLAHYTELEWAKKAGVEPHLIRISVGTEPKEQLKALFSQAFDACKKKNTQ